MDSKSSLMIPFPVQEVGNTFFCGVMVLIPTPPTFSAGSNKKFTAGSFWPVVSVATTLIVHLWGKLPFP